jgi:C-methyltransferase
MTQIGEAATRAAQAEPPGEVTARGEEVGPPGGVGARAAEARPLPAPPPRFVVAAVLRLRRALRVLADAVVPASVALFELTAGYMQTHLLRAAARLRLADLLAAGPATAEELAARTGVDAEGLRRLLRGLVTLGVFARRRDGRFRNNRISQALLSGAAISLRDCALYFGSESQLRAWNGLEETVAGGGDAFERVHGTNTWNWFEQHPDEQAAFAGTMVAVTRLYAPGVATAYPFGEVRRVCDVGGGHGDLLAEVLLRHPHLGAVLFDSPRVLATARSFLEARGVLERVELAAGSFFESVPAGCDCYLLKNILHDWDDERALRVLGNCRRAMEPGHRLLVVEVIVEEDTTNDIGPLSDLQMMVVCGGRERGRGDYARLFECAGFRLRRVVPTPGPMSVVEGLAV